MKPLRLRRADEVRAYTPGDLARHGCGSEIGIIEVGVLKRAIPIPTTVDSRTATPNPPARTMAQSGGCCGCE